MKAEPSTLAAWVHEVPGFLCTATALSCRLPFRMVQPVVNVNVTKEQAAAVIAGLDTNKEPWVLVFLLRPSDEAGPAGEAVPVVQGAKALGYRRPRR